MHFICLFVFFPLEYVFFSNTLYSLVKVSTQNGPERNPAVFLFFFAVVIVPGFILSSFPIKKK